MFASSLFSFCFLSLSVFHSIMPTFYIEDVTLSQSQRRKIFRKHPHGDGVTIQLRPRDFGGKDSIYLTMQQSKRFEKAEREKKGMRIRLSSTQLRYNIKNGSGFWSQLRTGTNAHHTVRGGELSDGASKGLAIGLPLAAAALGAFAYRNRGVRGSVRSPFASGSSYHSRLVGGS